MTFDDSALRKSTSRDQPETETDEEYGSDPWRRFEELDQDNLEDPKSKKTQRHDGTKRDTGTRKIEDGERAKQRGGGGGGVGNRARRGGVGVGGGFPWTENTSEDGRTSEADIDQRLDDINRSVQQSTLHLYLSLDNYPIFIIIIIFIQLLIY